MVILVLYTSGAGALPDALMVESVLSPVEPASTAQSPNVSRSWTNSLGMEFVLVPETKVRFCIWETRVMDFAAFIQATGYEAEEPMPVLAADGQNKRNWRAPGFPQETDHPVVLVSWEDALEFCVWLTKKEQAAGTLKTNQLYRLPTDAEWSQAVGDTRYPWNQILTTSVSLEKAPMAMGERIKDDRRFFPPPKGAGNYAGGEMRTQGVSSEFKTLNNYQDGYPRTAPVGSFAVNRYGIYDLGGNVWEWCQDWFRKDMITQELEDKLPYYNDDGGGKKYKVLRGASWLDSHPAVLRSSCRFFEFPYFRNDTIGFRVVLETP